VAAVSAPSGAAVRPPSGTAGRAPSGSGDPRARARRRLAAFRIAVLAVIGAFFLLPLAALVEFSTRGTGLGAPRTLAAWREIASKPELITAIESSLELAAVTSVAALLLMVPTLIWVRLRLPRLSRTVEFLCLLPLTVPPVALVVGLAPIYLWVTYLTGDRILNLTWAYVILVLPFVYRSLDSGLAGIDLRTLAEAARSLGASWLTVMWRVVAPNITSALLNAGLLSVSLVLGEFTFAQLLNYPNLQVTLNQIGQAEVGVTVAASAGSLFFVFLLLLALSFVGGRRRGGRGATAMTAAGAAAEKE
jgi:putative spermidine/putrescine transport system permease protein